jgi:hypothetical protein
VEVPNFRIHKRKIPGGYYTVKSICLLAVLLFVGCGNPLENLKLNAKLLHDMQNYNSAWITDLPHMTFSELKTMEVERLRIENKVLADLENTLQKLGVGDQ